MPIDLLKAHHTAPPWSRLPFNHDANVFPCAWPPNLTVRPSRVRNRMVWDESRSPIRRPARATMEWSKVTHDRRRLQLWETLRGEVGCVLQRGPSFAWLSQAITASKRGRRRLGDLSVSVRIGQRLLFDVRGFGYKP